MFHTMGPLWKQTPFSRTLLSLSFGVSSKGALPTGSLYRTPTERERRSVAKTLLHPSFKVPSK